VLSGDLPSGQPTGESSVVSNDQPSGELFVFLSGERTGQPIGEPSIVSTGDLPVNHQVSLVSCQVVSPLVSR
jgi:hypothetical protein